MSNKSSILLAQFIKTLPAEWHDHLTLLFRQAYADGYADGQQDLLESDEDDDDDLH